jgi:Zn-dependent M28 family amino/carboxypeptidase
VPSPLHARWAVGVSAAAVTGLALTTALSAPTFAEPPSADSSEFRAEVTTAGIVEHLQAFQAIADAHDGTRASGTPGYQASVDYVVEKLTAAGYSPTVQEFDFPFFQELSEPVLEPTSPGGVPYETPADFSTMTYSGSGDVTAVVQAVDTDGTPASDTYASTSGCEMEDFADFEAGNIALMQRGSCPFGQKAANAQESGAVGAIIFNSGAEGATDSYGGTLGSPDFTIPVVGSSFALGQDLLDPAGTEVHLATETISDIRQTYNVIADLPGSKGTGQKVVQAGAHLDGVLEGAGMNDNGSGSASLLEVAEAMADETPAKTMRFSWWGAEELGLLGAEHYVADLAENDPEALKAIELYLNFDMVGSPNYVRFVYDGDNSAYGEDEGAAIGPKGSGNIEKTFHDYFASQGLASEETPFSGRSDYGPFIDQGIPSGGLFTGAEGVKTEDQAKLYGGTAGVAYDECYHSECDDIDNVSEQAITEMSGAIAHAVWVYAMDARSVKAPTPSARPAKSTGEKRAEAHDLHAPGEHGKRR